MVNLYVGHRTRQIVAEDIVNGTIPEDVVQDLVEEDVDHHNVTIVKAREKAAKMEPPPVVKEVVAEMDPHAVTDQDAGVEAMSADTTEVLPIVDHHLAAIKMRMAMDRQEGAGPLEDSSAETSEVEEEAEDDHILKTVKISLENKLVRMDPDNNNNVAIRVIADVAHHVHEAETPSPSPVTTQIR